MKEEVNTILRFLECDENSSRLRGWLHSLTASQSNQLKEGIDKLLDAIKQFNMQDIQQAGVYYLFLGSVYYEQDDYQKAIHSLENAINGLSGTQVNKSLAHWLFGLSYQKMMDFPKARLELTKALQMVSVNTNINTFRINNEYQKRHEITQEIQSALDELIDKPLFRNVPPEPDQLADQPPSQNPPTAKGQQTDRENSQENTASSSSSKIPGKENFSYQETHSDGYISFQFFKSIPPASSQASENSAEGKSSKIQKEENNSLDNETRTDGYISFPSIPIYAQTASAGKSGKPEIILNIIGSTETRIVSLENKPHKIYPLKSTSNEIKVTFNEKKWGWVKILGNSMNNIANKTSIMDGDLVLLLFTPNADDNDIVLASFDDRQTTQSFLTVKRYRKWEQSLNPETAETGTEYKKIFLGDLDNARIIGIVYAVAKPI